MKKGRNKTVAEEKKEQGLPQEEPPREEPPREEPAEETAKAAPEADPQVERQRSRIVLEGSVTSPINLPDNCRFCTRCRYCTERCKTEAPRLTEVKPGHFVACHRVE